MNDDAALLSRLGAALAVEPTVPDDAALASLTAAVRAKRIERTESLRDEARAERRRILRGSPARRYAAVAAALAVSPIAACATTAVAGIEPPAPLRPIAELLGLTADAPTPDPAGTDVPAYQSQALGADAPTDGVADTDPAVTPTGSSGTGGSTASAAPPVTIPAIDRTHTTVPEPPGTAVPNITPGTTVPPTDDPTILPVPDPVPTPDPVPAPTPGNAPPPAPAGGPGANRGN